MIKELKKRVDTGTFANGTIYIEKYGHGGYIIEHQG